MTPLEDLEADIRHLHHLIDTICDIAFGVADQAGRERIDALLWIARDRALFCKDRAHDLVWPGDKGCAK